MIPMHCLIWDDQSISSYETILGELGRFESGLKIHVNYVGKQNHKCRREAEGLFASHRDLDSADIVLHVCMDRDVESLIEEFGSQVSLAFLDEKYDAGGDDYYGSKTLAPLLRRKRPDVMNVIASMHATTDDRVAGGITHGQVDIWVDKLSFDNPSSGTSRLLASLLLSHLRQHRAVQQLQKSRPSTASMAIGASSLIQSLVGMDDFLGELNLEVLTFLQYKALRATDYRNRWKGQKPRTFTPAISMVGEPGCGKSTIIKGLAELFDAVYTLPADAVPGKTAGTWIKPWRAFVQQIESLFEKDQISLISLDDALFVSRNAAGAHDIALSADWGAFQLAIKELIENCGKKNNERHAKGFYVYPGKVLWVMAFNPVDGAGHINEALGSMFTPHTVEFPRDPHERKQILLDALGKAGLSIEDAACDRLLENTQHYRGRDLLGHAGAGRGIIVHWQQTKLAFQDEEILDEQGNMVRCGDIPGYWTLTVQDVDAWLKSNKHRAITEDFRKRNPQLALETSQPTKGETPQSSHREGKETVANQSKPGGGNTEPEACVLEQLTPPPEILRAERLRDVLRAVQADQKFPSMQEVIHRVDGGDSRPSTPTVAKRGLEAILKHIYDGTSNRHGLQNQLLVRAHPQFNELQSDPLLQVVWSFVGKKTITWEGVSEKIRERQP